ncbi:tRNA synthetase class I [Xylaria bambusicola]|uniref:tRNA synthetase class I n=1 Tax=Xylaria bambusicola TaxID=326684 RepID=UPI0020072A82|nr:tRNA synthetase class I [Xylaria bambusicola]KAI0505647.1 tRNA synthetase class I [Xylaria bambusicola]
MFTRALQTASSLSRRNLCRTCLLRSIAAPRQHRRPLHLSTIAKRDAAQEAWDQRAERIKNGEEPNLWTSFKERGYVKDIAGTDEQISELMRRKRIGVYVGIDPTAASLHLGHLLPLMPVFWMYMHGYRAITMIGGATAKVGDPTDRLQTREDMPRADSAMYTTKMHYQLKRIWQNVDKQAARYGYQKEWAWNRELLNNSTWFSSSSFIEVVNRLFKRMRVGPMLARETVKRKMTEGDGVSLAEFVYPMMQAWDFWKMFSGPKGVCMQVGGSDQYGNITAGIDAVKMLRDTEPDPVSKLPADLLHTPVGFTVPLLTDSAGNKFGKSAGNAMWLDPFMTNSFDLYGYFMRRPDDEVEKLLKLFTFLPLEEINKIMKEHNLDPAKRHAHHILAFEVLALVHSLEEARATQDRHKLMFSKDKPFVTPVSTGELESFPDRVEPATSALALNFRPDIQLPESLILGQSIARIIYAAGLADSISDAHRLVAHRGAYVGGAPGRTARTNEPMREGEVTFQSVKNWFPQETKNFLIDNKILVLRRGKHFIRIIEMVSDEEWEASGNVYSGEPNKGRLRLLREQLIAANGGKNTSPPFSTAELARVGEQLARIESAGDNALEEADTSKPPQIKFPPERTRAAQLLDKYTQARQLNPHINLSMKQKTEAIDKVLAEAQSVLENKKRMRDEVLAQASAAGEEKKVWS